MLTLQLMEATLTLASVHTEEDAWICLTARASPSQGNLQLKYLKKSRPVSQFQGPVTDGPVCPVLVTVFI